MKVIKVAKPGKSISSTDPRDLSFDSKNHQAIIRMVDTGHNTVNLLTGSAFKKTSVIIPHNLGYPPLFQLFCRWRWNSGAIQSPIEPASSYCIGFSPTAPSQIYSEPSVDDTNLTLNFINVGGGANKSVEYWYFIGRDPAN